MALIDCPDCGKAISDQAPACPNCGRPIAHQTSAPVQDVNATGFLGKPGTFAHTANVGCLAIIIAVVVLLILIISLK